MTRILVADNDSDMRALLRELLEDEGYQVTEAADGRAVLAHLRMTDAPMVVLLDQRMPSLTGAEVVDLYLHAGNPTTPWGVHRADRQPRTSEDRPQRSGARDRQAV